MTCIDAFKNLNVANFQGQLKVSPCCAMPTKNTTTVDFYSNAYLVKIRDHWAQNIWPSECKNCKNQEQANLPSRRQGSNNWYAERNINDTQVELIRLDYWVGDTCNLACAICGPSNSSTWKKELKIPVSSSPAVVNKFWRNLDLSSLKSIHFHGGEPLLSKEHVEFLLAVPNKQQVEITYNTNATVKAGQSLLDLWKEFRLVVLDFSIDDIGKRFEYQRYPASWDKVVKNMNWYLSAAHHNTMFNINTTVSWLNRCSLSSLDEWVSKNFYVSRFGDPIQHRKQFAAGQLDINQNLETVKKYLNDIDSRRGTNWRETFPELVDYCPGQTGASDV
jgi:sulfatase maturation enzyme AslB (radical SAM superfamily)